MTNADGNRDQVDREEFLLQATSVAVMATQIAEVGPIPPRAAQAVAAARMVLGAFVD